MKMSYSPVGVYGSQLESSEVTAHCVGQAGCHCSWFCDKRTTSHAAVSQHERVSGLFAHYSPDKIGVCEAHNHDRHTRSTI